MKTHTSWLALLLAAFALSCTTLPGADNSSAPQAVPVVTLKASTETTYQEYPAAITGLSTVEIRPQVAGILERVYVDEGTFVREGQPLFKIDDRPFTEQLNQANANLQAAEAAVESAKLEVEKMSRLTEQKMLSDFQLKTAQAAHKAALAQLEQAKAQVASARINVGYTTIKAPVSGYIGRLLRKQGSLVSPTDPDALTQLSDVRQLHVYFSLAERDFIRFRDQYTGNSLEEKLANVPPVHLILPDNSVYQSPGKIDMVDGQFDPNTGAITLRATFPNENGLLRAGNTGKIRLGLKHREAILVPQSATVELQDKIFVYALDDSNKVAKQPISIIAKSGPNYLIRHGLRSGDRIVVKGMDYLQDGQVINPQPLSADSIKRIAFN